MCLQCCSVVIGVVCPLVFVYANVNVLIANCICLLKSYIINIMGRLQYCQSVLFFDI